MRKGILGKKIGMTQVFDGEGLVTPVTVVQAGPCVVLQKKEEATDGYSSIQLGFLDKKEHRATKSEIGHAKKAEAAPQKFVKEFRDVDMDKYQVADKLGVDLFAEGDVVDVTGTSRGKGFAGSIKRHNHSRGPMSHGSRYHRGPGSLGAIAANRVFKGHKLPGRMGGEQVTTQNLSVVRIDAERNLLMIKGAIPGPRNGYVVIKSAVKGS